MRAPVEKVYVLVWTKSHELQGNAFGDMGSLVVYAGDLAGN